jgi:hypothetical protein
MPPSDSEKSTFGYPIQFTASLPLEECANRIRQSFDKRMGMSFAHMQGHLEKIDASTYEFLLYQELKNSRETVSGRFIAQTASSTLIEASFKRDMRSDWMFIPILFITIVTCFAGSTALGLVALAITTALLGLYIYLKRKAKNSPPRKPKYAPASELLWYFERTLKN